MNKRWNEIFNLRAKTSLTNVKEQLEALKFKKTFKVINVVGTNGKGSSVNMISNALRAKGYKVGVFTSPHLILPNERISINGKDISDEEFFSIFDRVNPKQFFEATFVVAMKYFEEQAIDYAVVEAGVGGKLDSTNAVDGDYGLLTSIALDHTEYLGDTHQKIFDDKVQIANNGMKFFVPSHLPSDVKHYLKVIDNEAKTHKERNSKLVDGFLKECFDINLEDQSLPKGRTQQVTINGVECILDVAHNKDGIKASLEQLQAQDIQFEEVVITLANRKDISGILELFGNKKISFYKPDATFRAFDLEEIKDINSYKPSKKTLFIGSFRLIGGLYE